ncbi:hypothetical protein [Mesorhizobium sp. M0701]|uniref:hypothetical protein n=1 Tax=unclassified Mesorhizobium TaxID=325217 RepID=UPI00333751A6
MDETFEENVRSENAFIYRLGLVITEWQWVEAACYELYAAIMRGANKKLISVNWHNVQSFDARITLLERCIFFVLPVETRDNEWKDLKKAIREASEQRNAIVHSTFGVEFHDGVGTPRLSPSHMDATAIVKKRAMNPSYVYGIERLQEEGAKFKALSHQIKGFARLRFPHREEDGGG